MHQHPRQNTSFTGLSGDCEALFAAPHRFSFNGKESDSEVKGEGNSLDFGARMYDSRSGKWLAIDPLSSRFPYSSTYAYCENSPLFFIDPDGRSIKPSTGEARVAIQAQLDNFNQNTTLAQIFGNTNYGRIGRFNDPNNQSNLRQNQQVNGFSLVGMNYATAKRILENDKTGLTVEQKLQALAWLRALSAMDIAEIAIFNNTQVTPNVNPNIGQGNGITDNSLITTNQAIPTFLTAIATVLGNPVQQDNLINGFEASATGSNGVPFLPASPLPTGELPANLQNDSNQALRIIGLYPIANTASNPATTADLLRAVVNFGVMSGPIKINEGSSQSEMQSNGTVTTTPR